MRVAIVEDSTEIAEMLRTLLEWEGMEVVTFTADFAALLSEVPWEGIDVAVIDLMLPEVDGERILAYLADHRPGVRRVVLSAVAHQRPGLDRVATVLTKPAPADLLISAIRGHDA